jgi:UDPglucose 6-dehydrogenase
VLFQKIHQQFGGDFKDKTIAIWGLAFKPKTDDVREAPALVLIDALLEAGVHVRVHDPESIGHVRSLYGDRIAYCDRPYGALEQADALAVVTEWNEFRNPDFEVMRRLMRQPIIFDGRNVFDPLRMAALGFIYHGIGRAKVVNG